MKNVLVIVYYFPPMGGSGVQRPLKFVKYLREFGWNPFVLCPQPGIYPYFDESLQTELEKLKVEVHRVEANTLFHLGTSGSSSPQKKKQVPDLLARLGRRVLRLFMYPDNKKGWIEPAIEEGGTIIEEKSIDLIFSTAPPFSNHIIGKKLSQKYGLPLALDYRDAWLNNHFMDDMFGWQKKIMHSMEQECLQTANLVIGLDGFMLKNMDRSYGRILEKSEVIPHGFDPEDFNGKQAPSLTRKKEKLNFLYSGLFYEDNQPDNFLEGINRAIDSGEIDKKDVFLHFQGGLDARIKKLLKDYGWSDQYTDLGYQTHSKAVTNLLEADVLWMISNFAAKHKQVKSGKLFEYIGSQKPVLGLVHQGEESELLAEYGAGYQAAPNEPDTIARELSRIYKAWKKARLPQPDQHFVEKFNRRNLTGKLAESFNEISSP